MDDSKSLEILSSLSSLYPLQESEKEAIDYAVNKMSIKATMKVEEGCDDRAEFYDYCPSCNSDLRHYNLSDSMYSPQVKYCPFCGQRIEEAE